MAISKSTEKNWRRLRDSVRKPLEHRANKTESFKRFIPTERCKYYRTSRFIEKLFEFEDDFSVESILYSLCLSLFERTEALPELVSAFKDEYGHIQEIEPIVKKVLPEEFDILGTVYQSFLSEGSKNKNGSYYTPESVAISGLNGLGIKNGSKFWDPCCGSGTFLILAARRGAEVFGIDKDPIAVMIAKANLIAEGLSRYPEVRCIDFKSFLASDRREFDCCASNPPWGGEESSSYSDLSCEFFFETAKRLKDGGKISFLLPDSLLNVKRHIAFRKKILRELRVEKIRKFRPIFKGVQSCFFLLTAAKKKPTAFTRVTNEHGRTVTVPVKLFQLTHQKTIFFVTAEEAVVLKKILAKGTVDLNKSRWGIGIVTGNNKEHLKKQPERGLEPIYSGMEISSYRLTSPRYFIKFDRKNFQQCAPDSLYRSPLKLVYRFICKRPIFAIDRTGALVLNSANILIPQVESLSPEAIVALLNSEVIAFVYKVLFSEVKVLKSNLLQLRLPLLSQATQEELKKLVRMAEESDGFEKAINKIIYDAYDLSEEERRIIVQRTENND